jgi:hypothetical protein
MSDLSSKPLSALELPKPLGGFEFPKPLGGFEFPKVGLRNVEIPEFQAVSQNPNLASEIEGHLKLMVYDFEQALEPQQEIGICLVSFGHSVVFHLCQIRACDPSLIRFAGVTEAGDPVELVQHVSQISLLFLRVSALTPEVKPHPGRTALPQAPPTHREFRYMKRPGTRASNSASVSAFRTGTVGSRGFRGGTVRLKRSPSSMFCDSTCKSRTKPR